MIKLNIKYQNILLITYQDIIRSKTNTRKLFERKILFSLYYSTNQKIILF